MMGLDTAVDNIQAYRHFHTDPLPYTCKIMIIKCNTHGAGWMEVDDKSLIRTTIRDTVVDALAYLTSYQDRMQEAPTPTEHQKAVTPSDNGPKPAIQASVVTRLNSKWAEFVTDTPPGVRATCSILAHSLGSVIIYDLLAIPGPSPFSFPLHSLIFIGSPVGLFGVARQNTAEESEKYIYIYTQPLVFA